MCAFRGTRKECEVNMDITIWILRILYILVICLDVFLIIKKIMSAKIKQNVIYYSNWIFYIFSLVGIIINFTFFMTDLIGKSWNNLSQISFIMLIVFSCINPIISIGIFIGTCKHLIINEESFVICRLFSKRTINFKDINIRESRYSFKIGEGNKIFPNKGIFESKEFLVLKLNTGEILNINLNCLLYSGSFTELYLTIIKKLKIKRLMDD